MYYIISPENIEELKQYKIKCQIKDTELIVYRKENGDSIHDLSPFILGTETKKKLLIETLALDIYALSLCYNQPLYIYILPNKICHKLLPQSLVSCQIRNIDKLEYLQREDKYDLILTDKYYNGDYDYIIKELNTILNNINMTNIGYEFKLTIENGFSELKEIEA